MRMPRKNPEASSIDKVKKELEAAAGRPLDLSPAQLLKLIYPVGSHIYFRSVDESFITWQHIFLPRKTCLATSVIDVCAFSATANDGKRVLLLSDFVCFNPPPIPSLSEPVNIVVTPQTERPFFATAAHSLVKSSSNPQIDSDLQITVFTWDPNG